MAIKTTELVLTKDTGAAIKSGVKNNLFPDGRLTDGTLYERVEVRNNNASLTLSSVKAWCYSDPKGGSFAIALASASAIANGAAWPNVNDAGLTYSTPTTQAAGLALPTLAAGNKALLVIRRSLATGTTAYPESNRLYVGGTSPI